MSNCIRVQVLLSAAIFCMHSALYSDVDVVGPVMISSAPITLSANSQNYALSRDVTGNITITGNDVALNLNQHVVTGRIIISGQRVVVYDGNVIAPAPADNATADAGVIDIATSAANAQILDCYISAVDGTVGGVRGARGIDFAAAPDIMVHNCVVVAGKGGPVGGISDGGTGIAGSGDRFILEGSQVVGGSGSDSTSGAITTGDGGQGLSITGGVLCSVLSSTITGGNAGSVNTANDVGTVTFGSGGNNTINALAFSLQDSTFFGGNGGAVVTTGNIGVGGAVTGGAGAVGLQITTAAIINGLISDSTIFGGTSTVFSGTNIGVSGAVTQGASGHGLFIQAGRALIENSVIRGGSGGALTATGVIGDGAVVSGSTVGAGLLGNSSNVNVAINNSQISGGDSGSLSATDIATLSSVGRGLAGFGIHNLGGSFSIDASTIIGGSVPTITLVAGNVGSAATGLSSSGSGASAIRAFGSHCAMSIEHSTIIGGDAAGLSTLGVVNNIIAGSRGGHGVRLDQTSDATSSPEVVVVECQIFGGKAGDISSGTVGSLATVTANSGGNGIEVSALSGFSSILDSAITTYRGGDITGAPGAFAITGGDGGIGLNLSGAGVTAIIISQNAIVQTGRGGNVPAGKTNGDGGDGIFVSAAVVSAELSKNTIAYTGAAGTGGIGGAAGFAINSASIAPGMMIYGNYAHDIANVTAYSLGLGSAIDAVTDGTLFSAAAGLNFLFNIHKNP